VAVTEIGKPPACVGVPESVSPENIIPVGSVPERLNVYGATPPDAAKVVEG